MKLNKNIFIIVALLAAMSCNSKQNNIENKKAATEKTDTVATKEDTKEATEDSVFSVTGKLSFNGVIDILPQNIQTITSTLGGKIISTKVLPGQLVNKGALIAIIENPAFIDLQQTYIDAHSQVEYLYAEYNRQKVLADEQAASQKKFQQSKADYLSMKGKMDAAATQLRLLGVNVNKIISGGIQPYIHIVTPKGGYVGDVAINDGKYVNAGEQICEIIDKKSPLVKLSIYEKDLGEVNQGAQIIFKVNGLGDETFKAKIISIGQKVDKQTRSVQVFCSIIGNVSKFRPGMYVSAHIAD